VLTDEQVKQKTEDVLEALRDVVDPELGINVVDLGLIYGVLLDGPDHSGCPSDTYTAFGLNSVPFSYGLLHQKAV
jgi:metal-sulfur cluster biosynthetic enzyme